MTTIADHSTKVKRALALSNIGGWVSTADHPVKNGPCHGSAAAMLAAIPEEVIAALSARLLARLLDANWGATQQSKAIAISEACRDGFVWDAARGCSRDIVS